MSSKIILPAIGVLWLATAATWAQQDQKQVRVRVRATASDLNRYEPLQWNAVRVQGVNPRDEDVESQIAVHFGDDDRMQYVRKLWIPARSQRDAWLPVQIPAVETGSQQLPITASVLGSSSEREVFQRREGELLQAKGALIVDHDRIKTATMFPKTGIGRAAATQALDRQAYETIVGSRELSRQSSAVMDVFEDFLPTTPRALDSIDQLVLASDRIVNDSAGLDAVRDWVQRGARLWIMLDRVKPETVATIMGDSVSHAVVDRVELTEFTITDLTRPPDVDRESHWESEVSVDFVRVLTDSDDVHCSINGWPAAFWQPFGDGEVLFTTLDARGWRFDEEFRTNEWAVKGLDTVANRFYQERVEGKLPEEEIKPILQEQIGYSIPSRSLATYLLGFNCIAILGAGLWLGYRQQLEWLAAAVPLITLVSGGVLLVIGTTNSRSVPSMMAAVQLVRLDSGSSQANVSGLAAIYAQETTDLGLDSDESGLAIPERDESSSEIKRLLYDDAGTSRWVNVKAPAGSVRFVTFNHTTRLAAPIRAHGHFGPNGFEGRMDNGTQLGDLVIVSPPAPSLAVSLDNGGSFRSGATNVLAPNQYLADTFLSDEQRRRSTVYRKLLDPTDEMNFPSNPTLFAWSNAMNSKMALPEGFQKTGTSLIAVPLQIARTPSGTSFHVPATFVRVEAFLGEHGRSSVFNPRSGVWYQSGTATTTDLRFVLPKAVQPCQLNRAVLTFKINAPSRKVELNYTRGEETVLFREFESPSGVMVIAINDPEVLQLDAGGGLRLSFVVSLTERQLEIQEAQEAEEAAEAASSEPVADPAEGDGFDDTPVKQELFDNATWKIDYVRMDVFGETP